MPTHHRVTYCVGIEYNKGGTNPQGQIQLILQRSDGCTYYVKSNSISSLAFSNPVNGGLPQGRDDLHEGEHLQGQQRTGASTSIDGGVTLRVDAHEGVC